MRDSTDTRARIQEIALQLFTEKGYEATSLREIAEALGVTKAALYYHFKTKDDIVASLAEDRQASMRRLVEWAKERPHTLENRREFIRLYADDLYSSRHHVFMRFMERNQTALRDHPKFEKMRAFRNDIIDILSDESDSVTQRLRSAMAMFTLHAAWFVLEEDAKLSDEDRKEAALAVALELLEPRP